MKGNNEGKEGQGEEGKEEALNIDTTITSTTTSREQRGAPSNQTTSPRQPLKTAIRYPEGFDRIQMECCLLAEFSMQAWLAVPMSSNLQLFISNISGELFFGWVET